MTMQVEDQFDHGGRRLAISTVTGRGMFRPEDFGLTPRRLISSCNRGYRCRYAVTGGSLRLRHLVIGIDRPRPLLGGLPLPDGGDLWRVYEDLPEPVPF